MNASRPTIERLTLLGFVGERHVYIYLDVYDICNRWYIEAAICIDEPGWQWATATAGTNFSGYDLLQFAAEVDRVCETLSGSARLYGYETSTVLCATCVDPTNGEVIVGGHIGHYTGWPDKHSEDNFIGDRSWPVNCLFEGIQTDHTGLKEYASSIRRFLRNYDIDTSQPE